MGELDDFPREGPSVMGVLIGVLTFLAVLAVVVAVAVAILR